MTDLSADRPLLLPEDHDALELLLLEPCTERCQFYRGPNVVGACPSCSAVAILRHFGPRLLPPSAEHREAHVLASGEYSDFGVHAAFERREDAVAAMEAGAGDNVLDLPLYPAGVLPRPMTEYTCHATVSEHAEWDHAPWSSEFQTWDYKPEIARACEPREGFDRQRKERWFRASGSDRDAVVKSVSDRYAKARAERDGL